MIVTIVLSYSLMLPLLKWSAVVYILSVSLWRNVLYKNDKVIKRELYLGIFWSFILLNFDCGPSGKKHFSGFACLVLGDSAVKLWKANYVLCLGGNIKLLKLEEERMATGLKGSWEHEESIL